MENHIDQIEKFLKGQMSPKEEGAFKESLMADHHMRTCALIMTFIIKTQKSE